MGKEEVQLQLHFWKTNGFMFELLPPLAIIGCICMYVNVCGRTSYVLVCWDKLVRLGEDELL